MIYRTPYEFRFCDACCTTSHVFVYLYHVRHTDIFFTYHYKKGLLAAKLKQSTENRHPAAYEIMCLYNGKKIYFVFRYHPEMEMKVASAGFGFTRAGDDMLGHVPIGREHC